MEREIKFRGLNEKGHWRYGFVVFQLDQWLICDTVEIAPCMSDPGGDTRFYKDVVKPETISQFTWRKEKNDKEIYGGDIIKIDRYEEPLIGEIRQLDSGQWYIDHPKISLKYQHQVHCEICETDSTVFFLNFFDGYELEKIGNIYQHPELLQS